MARLDEVLNFSSDTTIKILDFGCGDGSIMSNLTHKGFSNVFGFDIVAWQDIQLIPNRIIESNSMEYLEKNSTEFDVIFSREVLYYTPVYDQKRLWEALYKSLKPGGQLVVICFNGALTTSSWILQKDLDMKFAFNEFTLARFAKTAGFSRITVEPLVPEYRTLRAKLFAPPILLIGKYFNKVRFFVERGRDPQNPTIFSKQILIRAHKDF